MYYCECGKECKNKSGYSWHKKSCSGPKFCLNPECKKLLINFQKKFCSISCSAKITLKGRKLKLETRKKISLSLGGDGKNSYITDDSTCLNCNRIIPYYKKYCNNKCQNDYKYKCWIEKWLNGEISGLVKGGASGFIRRYLQETYENKCSLCGWKEINPITKNIPIELDHKDGDHTNNRPENVRLVCPNCHSLTPTYKALNTGNGRSFRRKAWIP